MVYMCPKQTNNQNKHKHWQTGESFGKVAGFSCKYPKIKPAAVGENGAGEGVEELRFVMVCIARIMKRVNIDQCKEKEFLRRIKKMPLSLSAYLSLC